MNKLSLFALTFAAVATSCAGPSRQLAPMPDPKSAVRADSTRIYVGRREQTAGSWRNVRVFDNDREVGVLGVDEYMCWDRPAKRGVARFIFEGLGFDQDAIESVCELPAEPGATVYLGITIDRAGHKPVIERVTDKVGHDALKSRTPAQTGD